MKPSRTHRVRSARKNAATCKKCGGRLALAGGVLLELKYFLLFLKQFFIFLKIFFAECFLHSAKALLSEKNIRQRVFCLLFFAVWPLPSDVIGDGLHYMTVTFLGDQGPLYDVSTSHLYQIQVTGVKLCSSPILSS